MPKTERTPKELLADRELLGFSRPTDGDGQVIHRASSAKVTEKPTLREEPAEASTPCSPRRGGD